MWELGGVHRSQWTAHACSFICLWAHFPIILYGSTNLVQETFGGAQRYLERWIKDEGDSTRGVRRIICKTYEAMTMLFDPIFMYDLT
jgi:hypothetical protein